MNTSLQVACRLLERTVRAFVPRERALPASSDNKPLHDDDPSHRHERLHSEEDDEAHRDEAIEDTGPRPMRCKHVESTSTIYEDAKDLCSGHRCTGPVDSGERGDEEVQSQNERVWQNEVRGLALVISSTERRNGLAWLCIIRSALRAFGEPKSVRVPSDHRSTCEIGKHDSHDSLAALVAYPHGSCRVHAIPPGQSPGSHDGLLSDLTAGEKDHTVGNHGAVSDDNLVRAESVRRERLGAGTKNDVVTDFEQLRVGAVNSRARPVDALADLCAHGAPERLRVS